MLNVFITYHCNFHCNYCFVRGFEKQYPMYMEMETFHTLCQWLKKHKIYAIGILGGEPTTHPELIQILRLLNESGVSPVLFTNALFPISLADELAEYTANFVINYNDPGNYTKELWERMQDNIKRLRILGANMAFSKNFSKGALNYQYVLEGARKYGIKNIRYDIARPGPMESNCYFDLNDTKKITDNILSFVRECEESGIGTGLDCCVPLCYFDADSLQYMRNVSAKFSGICHPSVDIQTDLSASYCIPMEQVKVADITRFHGELSIISHFSNEVKGLRLEKKLYQCKNCEMFGRQCQGGCLALKQAL